MKLKECADVLTIVGFAVACGASEINWQLVGLACIALGLYFLKRSETT